MRQQKQRLIEIGKFEIAKLKVKDFLKNYPDISPEVRQLLEMLPYRFVDYKWKDIARYQENSKHEGFKEMLNELMLVASNYEFVKANYILSERLREKGYRYQEHDRMSGATKNLEHKDVPELVYGSPEFAFLDEVPPS